MNYTNIQLKEIFNKIEEALFRAINGKRAFQIVFTDLAFYLSTKIGYYGKRKPSMKNIFFISLILIFIVSSCEVKKSPSKVLEEYLFAQLDNPKRRHELLSEKDKPFSDPVLSLALIWPSEFIKWYKKHYSFKYKVIYSSDKEIIYEVITKQPDSGIIYDVISPLIKKNVENLAFEEFEENERIRYKKIVEVYSTVEPPLIESNPIKYTLIKENGEWKVFENLKEKEEKEKLLKKDYVSNISIDVLETNEYKDGSLFMDLNIKNKGNHKIMITSISIFYLDKNNEIIGEDNPELFLMLKPNYEEKYILTNRELHPPVNWSKRQKIEVTNVHFLSNFTYP